MRFLLHLVDDIQKHRLRSELSLEKCYSDSTNLRWRLIVPVLSHPVESHWNKDIKHECQDRKQYSTRLPLSYKSAHSRSAIKTYRALNDDLKWILFQLVKVKVAMVIFRRCLSATSDALNVVELSAHTHMIAYQFALLFLERREWVIEYSNFPFKDVDC